LKSVDQLASQSHAKAGPTMSPPQELDYGERLKQKSKKNKIGSLGPGTFAESPGSGFSSGSGSRSSEPSEPSEPFSLESSKSNQTHSPSTSRQIYQETHRPLNPKARESWAPQVPWLREDLREDGTQAARVARREKRRSEDGSNGWPRPWQPTQDRQDRQDRQDQDWPDWQKQTEWSGKHSGPERKEEWKHGWHERWTDQEWHYWQSQWQTAQPNYELGRSESAQSGWGSYVQVSDDGLLSIRLARMGLDVRAVQKFCAWLPTELQRLKQAKVRRLYVSSDDIVLAHDVDLSQNDLDDEAMRILLLTLKQARVVIGVAKFYQNRLGCRSAILLSQWIRSAPWALFELHLSHNQIKTAGALELIKAVAETKSYPSARPGSKNWPLPLWLRLEHNDIPEADSFEQKAELCLQTARPDTKGKLICWFAPRNRYGCRSDNCGHSTYNHCPVIHIPHLRPETRNGKVFAPADNEKVQKAPAAATAATCDSDPSVMSGMQLIAQAAVAYAKLPESGLHTSDIKESDIVMESSSDSLQRSGQEPMTTLCKDAEPEDCPVAPRSVFREGDFRALPSEAWSKIHSSFLHSEPNTLMTASAQPACHSAASIGDFRILPRSAWVRLHAPFQTT